MLTKLLAVLSSLYIFIFLSYILALIIQSTTSIDLGSTGVIVLVFLVSFPLALYITYLLYK